jgi:glycerol-3-phosphate acyltransferase PlsY
LVIFYSLRFVSLASVVAALSLPLFAWLYHYDPLALGVAGLVAVFVAVRHRANLVRLAQGTERRFERKPAAPKEPA